MPSLRTKGPAMLVTAIDLFWVMAVCLVILAVLAVLGRAGR